MSEKHGQPDYSASERLAIEDCPLGRGVMLTGQGMPFFSGLIELS